MVRNNVHAEMMISIIIPIYNDRNYIEKCLNSICNQTYANFEIICVDDFSDDGSWEYILERSRSDSRINLIKSSENRGAFVARKQGVMNACGEYILFFDADDYVSDGLLAELIDLVEIYKTDILHFSSEIIDCGVGSLFFDKMKVFAQPYEGQLYNNSIMQKCFLLEEYGFNVWDKLFRTTLCKKVFSLIPNEKIPKANDLFIYFFITGFANSYVGIKTINKYYYCYGIGDTGKNIVDMKLFCKYCSYKSTFDVLSRISSKCVNQEHLVETLKCIKNRLIQENVFIWMEKLQREEKKNGFQCLLELWDVSDITDKLFELYKDKQEQVAKNLLEYHMQQIKNTKCRKKIGIYYPRMGKGGVERVISLLIPIYIKIGFDIVLITDEQPDKDDYLLPMEVKRYVIPGTKEVLSKKCRYFKRASILKEILNNQKIDTLCYHAASSPLLLFDLIVVHSVRVELVLTKHEMFSQQMCLHKDVLSSMKEIYKLVDKLVVLSETEKAFWKVFGISSFYIPNPCHNINMDLLKSDKKLIVWVGRLEKIQKRYQDIIPIMKIVTKTVPNCMLHVYGNAETYRDIQLLQNQIKNNHLENNIIYCGYVKDVNMIYKEAGIHLVTSTFESFPMNIMESKQFGIPLVSYKMPYLEFMRETQGAFLVEQGDVEAAGKAVVELLTNDNLRKKMGEKAKISAEQFLKNDIKKCWDDLLNSKNLKEDDAADREEELQIIIETMVYHYGIGSRKLKKMQFELKDLRIEKGVNDVWRKSLETNLKIAIYPYGDIGKQFKSKLEDNGIEVSLIVDNKLAEPNKNIFSLSELQSSMIDEHLFVICSDKMGIYYEIRENISKIVQQSHIYDLFPLKL